jgi:hypothetical protein
VQIATEGTPVAGAHQLTPLDNATAGQIAGANLQVTIAPMSVAIYQVQ